MTCLTCKKKFAVVDTVHASKTEILRKRRCSQCGNVIYTSECVVDYEDIKDRWNINHRLTAFRKMPFK